MGRVNPYFMFSITFEDEKIEINLNFKLLIY